MSLVVHRSSDLLQRFAAGELDDAARAAVVAELAVCSECRAIVGALARGERATHRERARAEVPPTHVPEEPGGWIEAGKRIGGRYKVERVLGEGGMGVVYQVLHELLNRRFALKMLHPERGTHPGAVRRFLGEARTLASLGHEGIVDVVDLGHDDDESPFLVMEMLEGQSLEERLSDETRMPLEHAFDVALRIADALGAAHVGGIVHRDVKPANVFLRREPLRAGWVKLLDFGLAKLRSRGEEVGHDATLTRTGAIMGTPRYMAPEQWAADKDIDARADVFSWGVTVHRMLTGELPYRREGLDMLPPTFTAEAPDVRRLRPEIPLALSELIESSLAIDRTLRPLDGNVLAARWREAALQFATRRAESVRPRASRAPTEERARSSDFTQPIVGRARERQALLERIEARERPLLLVGPEGIGKSALLGAVAAVLDVVPHPLHGPTRVLRADGTGAGPLGPLVPLLDGDSHSEGAQSIERALRARLFGTGALDIVVLIGDPISLDPDSRRLISELGASVGAFVLGEARSLEAAASIDAEVFPLAGLSRDELGALAASFGVVLDAPGLDALATHTGGHPLFALQCLALKQERGTDIDSIPAQLEDAVSARLDAAPNEAAHAWQVASILRSPITLGDLLALGVIEAATGLGWLEAHGILERIGGSASAHREGSDASADAVAYGFTAGLLADVAERALIAEDRARLHRSAATLRTKGLRASSGPGSWARIARHHQLGGDVLRASDAFARAALGASAASLVADGVVVGPSASTDEVGFALRARWARVAQELAAQLDRVRADAVELELISIEGLEGEGRYEDAIAAIEALEHTRWTADQEARALVRKGSYHQRLGRHDAAMQAFQRAEARAKAGGVIDTLVLAQGRHAVCLALAQHLEDARDRLLAVEELVLTHSAGSQSSSDTLPNARRADLAGWKAQIAGLSGDLGERRDAYWAAVELFRAEGNHRFAAFSLLNLGDTYARLGAYDEAERALSRAQGECQLLGASTMAGYAALNLGHALLRLDRVDEARARMDEAHAIAARDGDRRLAAFTTLYCARLALEEHRTDCVDALVALLAEGTERDPSFRALGEATLARAALARGDERAALRHARAAEDIVLEAGALEEGEADVALVLADALLACGDTEEAQRVVRRAARRVQEVARKIAGAHWRARFTVDVPAHRMLLERAQI
jgi:serine/threonine-protein kinase